MRASYCYLPILPARSGAFRAVAALSPDAVSRITPMFDVPAPAQKNGKTIDAYLTEQLSDLVEELKGAQAVASHLEDRNPGEVKRI